MSNTVQVKHYVELKIDQWTQQGKPITTDQIRQWVDRMADMVLEDDPTDLLDRDQLVRDIEADFNIHIGDWNVLNDDTDHVPWIDQRVLEKDHWRFWRRYERYLRTDVGLPASAVLALDKVTDDILGRLEDPTRKGAWDRRGLVAGQVQSGKTGNYTGLITKAIDNGYKLIVVMAGVHNSLRSQTQARIDEGILGFDTRSIRRSIQATDVSSRIGVGKLAGPWLHVNSFTSSLDNGDFRLSVAQSMGVAPGGSDPIVLVVKKNKSILTNLYKWATHLNKVKNEETGEYKVPDVPVLVIDDEADHASVNTSYAKEGIDEETDPSAINGLIRRFLDTFEQTSYVAYTATPFANIFIDPEASHSKAGEDLFPRSFIINLPAPSNYIGPERVFGLAEDTASAIEEVRSLNIVRPVGDYEEWLPDKHKATTIPSPELPQSLKEAIVFFLMAGAVRTLRGQTGKHHSMLVHVTRFTDVQRQVKDQVSDFLDDVGNRLQLGEGSHKWLRDWIERLYDQDLVPTTEELDEQPDLAAQLGPVPDLDELVPTMGALAVRTKVHLVNGKSSDALEYVDHPEGLSVIAIGGDKLSRGLTLEGLTVSYYLRASKMYDTLMQMGRWFGYRPGYLDVCRLYTTHSLIDWYKNITAASAELQSEFDAMAAVLKTPEDFGLRVRQLPDGLLVTSPAKLKHAQKYSISFSGTISETVTFRIAARQRNLRALENLVAELGVETEIETGARIWRDIGPEPILAFLDGYEADRSAFKSQPSTLGDYIRARVVDGELGTWTVVLADVQNSAKHAVHGIAGRKVGLTQRANLTVGEEARTRYTIRRLVSPSHELVDFPKGSPGWDEALENTIGSWKANTKRKQGSKEPTRPSGLWERDRRPTSDGLLLLYPLDPAQWLEDQSGSDPFVGFALSFPFSKKAEPMEYQVNPVFLRNVFGWEGDDDE